MQWTLTVFQFGIENPANCSLKLLTALITYMFVCTPHTPDSVPIAFNCQVLKMGKKLDVVEAYEAWNNRWRRSRILNLFGRHLEQCSNLTCDYLSCFEGFRVRLPLGTQALVWSLFVLVFNFMCLHQKLIISIIVWGKYFKGNSKVPQDQCKQWGKEVYRERSQAD